MLWESTRPSAGLFHALNQRVEVPRPVPVVATFHDLFVMSGEYSSPEFRKRFTGQARQAADRADRIIAISQFTANQVRDRLQVDPARIRVVHHGVHQPDNAPPDEALRENIILHVGAIQKRKNVLRLIEAFEQVTPDWRMILAGSAGFDSEAVMERIGRSSAQPRITVTGYIARWDLVDLYMRARILAFPSLDEGFGIPALEAMAHGVAVLASNTSALPEVCGRAALLVDPHETDAIAQGLRRLTADDTLRAEYRRRGFLRAAEFSWEQTAKKTWKVYEELLGGSTSG